MLFKSSITRYLVVSFAILMAGLLTASSIIAAQAYSRYRLAGRIGELALADRHLFDALFAVRAQVPRVSTALIESDNPSDIIQDAHINAEAAVESASEALLRTGFPTRTQSQSAIRAAWRHLEELQGAVRSEAKLPRASRNLHDLDEWREAVHRTTDALGAASAAITNEIRIGDPLIAEMVEIRRLAWTVRDHYGLQCSLLRPNLAADVRLDSALLETWGGHRAIYSSAWQSLDELLLRRGISGVLRERVAAARAATQTAQADIDRIVAELNSTGRSPVPGDRWTSLCDDPFEAILAIAREAQQEANSRATAMRSNASWMLLWSGAGLLVAVTFGALVLLTVQRRLARPMRSLIATIARLSRRELKDPVPAPQSPDELGRMAQALEDLRESALAAERLQATMSRFTADASHQMRTPLTVLRTHISVLTTLIPKDSVARESLVDIEGAADRLQHLLIQLIKLARAEGTPAAEDGSGPTDLRQVMQEVTATFAPRASEAHLELHFEADQKAYPTSANALVIKEILTNLIDNAIRYNRPGGSVVVRLLDDSGHYAAEVEDDGPGIPESEHEKVFTRFYRMNRDQNRPGSGLGLAIVRSFAASVNARVTLCTGGGNHGLKVRIDFA